MPNRLANETSPYLLQHQDNPVDWYPWGDEALQKARAEDKPVLLSIGYSACHWCHVMEHESFENPDIARIMNENFVNIKVDREERPDLDSIYMDAVQAMTGHGGWPMTVFLAPDGRPFYGGTYFPPEDRMGMPGFPKVLRALAEAWRDRREELEHGAGELREHLAHVSHLQIPNREELSQETLDRALAALSQSYDTRHGGFGGAPKFPQPMTLEFALRSYKRTGDLRALDIVSHSLDEMSAGGIYDQIGGGFHRYAVDDRWLVPHFEKMLYDNSQLARLYLQAWLATENEHYRKVSEETLDYVRREMTSPEGGFYSTQDADSEGEEGKFYVWTPAQIREVLGPDDAAVVNLYYHVTERGNFEGTNVLSVPRPVDTIATLSSKEPGEVMEIVERSRKKLYEAREHRERPGRDEKVLTGWNGLMLRAFAEAAAALDRADYREIAVRNAEFVLSHLKAEDGRLLRTYKDGRARLNGYLEDYAFYADGLVSLYEATFDVRWLREARALADRMIEQFWDPGLPGFYDTSADHEQLFNRPRSLYDNAVPAGNSVACELLLRLSAFFAEFNYQDVAAKVLNSMAPIMAEHPTSFGRLLCAADFLVSTPLEVAIVGNPVEDRARALLREVYSRYLPNRVLAAAEPDDTQTTGYVALLAERPQVNGQPTAYVCHNYVCRQPVTSVAELAEQLGEEPSRSIAL
ncbi:MAG: thioredoxin domain-containing protein [Chloroflexota bacterium]|nr:thioredoxin domain-containing protein [Chloroflexota bacterium]